MSYDEELAACVRKALGAKRFQERKMFGGLCFMVGGAMCCGVLEDELIVRVPPDAMKAALAKPGARVFDFSGRPSPGMLYVGSRGTKTAKQLSAWIEHGLAVAAVKGKEKKAAMKRAVTKAAGKTRPAKKPAKKRTD